VKVGIDTSPLLQTRAGTARHVAGLLGALRERPELELVGLSAGGAGRLASARRDLLWYPLRLWRASARVDVLHCTTYRAPLRSRAPLVVTVHDLALVRHPEAFPRWHRATGGRALRAGVSAADAIVCVSAFTRAELVELLGVPPERTRIVPNAVDPVFTSDGARAEGDYVLAVGTLEPRKNLEAAVEAARLAGVELRVAGAAGWGGVAVEGWVGEPSDEELAMLMRGARCLVYPSLYEGFGLPVLEAMACGTPVVTSQGGATEELAAGAAVLVDPRDPAAIAAGIEEARRRRDELVTAGRHRAASFTWARSADLVEALWRELA
jgi:glycosyltransferase involved in cell wall biosynthesis